jgi:xanthine dehydrogenase accessory factor
VTTTAPDRLALLAKAVLSMPGRAVAGRVVDIQGFSTWSGDEMIVVGETDEQHGQVLGAPGAAQVRRAARELLAAETPGLGSTVVEIHGQDVVDAGLSCGGRAELLLQPTSSIPAELWQRLAVRAPVALLTRIDGPQRAAASLVVDRDGRTWGALPGDRTAAVAEARAVLAGGQSVSRRVTDEDGTVLVEAWIPSPRLVVVGAGDLVGAIAAQAGLLGWETCPVADTPPPVGEDTAWAELDEAFAWAGASAALVVLSHDPHVDVPALAAALDGGAPYVGAMGSRRTQSRRLDRLRADGRPEDQLDRIHRPIGLDLGGRSAPAVALAICAEILAVHCGRDGRPLRERTGPINDRPTATA